MIDDYRARIYRLVFGLAAIYNIAFGLWASLRPQLFFNLLEIAPPNYPGLWQCLGMVLGLYGVLYAYAVWRLDLARPIIGIGLAGKILGPIGWLNVVGSGEWPARTFTLIAFDDLAWWLPFALFLLEGTRAGEKIPRAAPFACAGLNALATVAMALVLAGGTELAPGFAERAAYISQHAALWRAGWAVWIAAAVSLVAFYAWWGAWLESPSWGVAATAVAIAGFVCDLFAESLFIGWLPERIDTLAPLASLLTGGVANGLYTVAGAMLTLGTPWLRGWLRLWAWAVWVGGFALTAFTLAASVAGIALSTAALMVLFCPWVAVFGWKLMQASKS
jgi:small multidrug resistance pump